MPKPMIVSSAQTTVNTTEHYAQTTQQWKKEIFKEIKAKIPRKIPVVIVKKFKPHNIVKQPINKVILKPKVTNYHTLPEAPNIIFKPTVQAPKVTVRPFINNHIDSPHTPNIYFEPIVEAPKVINYISAPKTRHASKKTRYVPKESAQRVGRHYAVGRSRIDMVEARKGYIKYKEKENTQPEQPKKEQKPKFVEKIKQVKETDAEEKRWKE
jgi:hypothetical protein